MSILIPIEEQISVILKEGAEDRIDQVMREASIGRDYKAKDLYEEAFGKKWRGTHKKSLEYVEPPFKELPFDLNGMTVQQAFDLFGVEVLDHIYISAHGETYPLNSRVIGTKCYTDLESFEEGSVITDDPADWANPSEIAYIGVRNSHSVLEDGCEDEE